MNGEKKTVVIIDDDDDLLRLVATSFRSQGFEVVEIKNGTDGLNYFSNEENAKKVSLLVLDRILPDMDGIDILQKLREKPLSFPVLILSSLSSEKDMMQGLSVGAVDYITKPFNINILMQKATALIKKS